MLGLSLLGFGAFAQVNSGSDGHDGDFQAFSHVVENLSAYRALERFKRSDQRYGLFTDEFGTVQGIITVNDILLALVGDVNEFLADRFTLVERADGSWLVDGDVGIERLKSVLGIVDDLPGEDENSFNTLGGFIMHTLGRVPAPPDHFEAAGWRLEVMDMDRNRVDKVLLSVLPPVAEDD